jgi:hypothetical protein
MTQSVLLVKGFVHRPGVHCASTAICDLVNYWGWNMNEAMCFGLASGLSFNYWVNSELTPSIMFGGRAACLEANFFPLLGIDFSWNVEPNEDSAWLSLVKEIGQSRPVILLADLKYLDYYNAKSHFNWHSVLAVGIDVVNEYAYMADTSFEELQLVSRTSLSLARSSDYPPGPVQYNWFSHRPVDTPHNLREVIKVALKRQAEHMLYDTTSGLSALERFCHVVSKVASASDWQACSRWGYQIIELRGTGGSLFRNLYCEFLRMVNQRRIFDCEQALRSLEDSSRLWQQVAMIFYKAYSGNDRTTLSGIEDFFAQILANERRCFEAILSCVS